MNTHSETFTPLVCRVTDDALLKAMPAIPQHRSVRVINFYRGRHAAEILCKLRFIILCKFCDSLGLDLVVGATGLQVKPGSLPFQKSEMGDTDTDTRRLCALIELTHCFAGR